MTASERANHLILMVEDTEEYAKLNFMVLKKHGFEVVYARDGHAAIEIINRVKPDVVLLDLNLPMVSGWEVLEHLYRTYGEGSARVIVTSAYGDTANRLVGKLQSVARYLVKPFTPQDLVQAIEQALNITT